MLRPGLNRPLDIDRRAQTQPLHDGVSLGTKTAALAANHVAALDFVRYHLVEESGHLVDAAATRGAVEPGGRGSGFHVRWVTGEWRIVAAAG